MSVRVSDREQRIFSHALQTMMSPDAFAEEKLWHEAVMTSLLPISCAYKAAIRVADPSGGFRMTPVGFEEAAIEEHRAYYHRFDFGRALGQAPKLATVFSRNEFYGPDLPRLRRTEYYSDYLAKYRVHDALCLATHTDDPGTGAVLYLWHERDLPEDRRLVALMILRLLAPAFRAGMSLGVQVRRHKSDLFAILDRCPEGFALFSRDGVAVHRNVAYTQMLANASDRSSLDAAVVASAAARAKGHNRGTGGAPVVCRIGRTDYEISNSPVGATARTPDEWILVTICPASSRSAARSTDPAHLRNSYGLTSRESEVAELLVLRMTNREVSARLGISEHTARHHTEIVFRKMGVSSRFGVADECARPLSGRSIAPRSMNRRLRE